MEEKVTGIGRWGEVHVAKLLQQLGLVGCQ